MPDFRVDESTKRLTFRDYANTNSRSDRDVSKKIRSHSSADEPFSQCGPFDIGGNGNRNFEGSLQGVDDADV